MSKQKAKGNSFERDIAKDLSERYNLSFIRSDGSGAFIGRSNNHRKDDLNEEQIRRFKGDISTPIEFSKLNIECKSYGTLSFSKLFTRNKQLDLWIDQALEPACEDDITVVMFKITRQGTYLCIEGNKHLDTSKGLYYHGWYIFDYDTFFKYNQENLKLISGE